jgi:hypothetical protein
VPAAAPAAPPPVTRTITLAEGMTVADLATKLDVKAKDVLRKLMDRRLMMTINSTLDDETASMIAREFGADVKMQTALKRRRSQRCAAYRSVEAGEANRFIDRSSFLTTRMAGIVVEGTRRNRRRKNVAIP